MKRKRGNKKNKKKDAKVLVQESKSTEVIVDSSNGEDESGSSSSEEEIDGSNDNKDDNSRGNDGKRVVEAPVVVVKSEPPLKEPVTVRLGGVGISRPPPMAVYGRVRVKLKTAAKPPVIPLVLPQCGSPLVGSRVGDVDGVRNGSESDKSRQEVSVEMKEDGGGEQEVVYHFPQLSEGSVLSPPDDKNVKEREISSEMKIDGGGGDEKVVVESGNLGSIESKKCESMGIKIVSSKSSGLSPPAADANEREVSVENKMDDGGEKGEEESGNLGSAESNRSEGTGIKIVSSKGWGWSPPGRNAKENSESILHEVEVEEGDDMEVDVLEEKPKSRNKRELVASLEVIRKVMKMDAAEPFNAPLNPTELGIPDYFDIIKTPMDFGTVRGNLESGAKYMDSKDVYKDVQYIWDNCYTYNNKSDYIVDLMKRVKKNFMKYWVAAGLYTEQTNKMIDGKSNAVDEPTTPGYGKKFKKGKGFKRHKDDCLCAICIMKRRRREREAREAREAGVISVSPQLRTSQTSMAQEYKQEENSQAESPVADNSSYMGTSPDGDADAEMEDGETGLDDIASQYANQKKAENDRIKFHDSSDKYIEISEKLLRNDKGDFELYSHDATNHQDNTGSRMTIDSQEQPSHPEEPASGYMQQRNELLELEKKRQRLRLLETFRDLENPMLSGLCSTLFPNKAQSVWNGANSLLQCRRSCHRNSGIQEAVASFINPTTKSASSIE